MAHAGDNPGLFRWKRLSASKALASKRVEKASQQALLEFFPQQRMASVKRNSHAVTLQSTEQLRDHDDAYNEARDLLNNWVSRKLHEELELGEDPALTSETDSSLAPPSPFLQQSNFDDLYSYLDQETDDHAVRSVLRELMELEVVDSGAAKDLASDRKRNATVSVEIKQQQARERRARREAERLRRRRERTILEEAREEARRLERREELGRRREEQRQEELLQREVVRLRKRMEEQRSLEQTVRLMEREKERRDKNAAIQASPPPDPAPETLQVQEQQNRETLRRMQALQSRVHMQNLRCLQHHFSKWYSAVLERRVQMANVAALHDWRRQLRVWREWRSLVWARRREREATGTEEELRTETRRCQVALESDRRRLLRRCLSAWRIFVRAERSRQDLLVQQVETQHKMAALIDAATSGKKLGSSDTPPSVPGPSPPTTAAPPGIPPSRPQIDQEGAQTSVSARPPTPAVPDVAPPSPEAPPARAGREGSRRRVAIDVQEECRKKEERRHVAEQQRQLLREQRQEISLLLEKQRRLECQRTEQRTLGEKRQAQITAVPRRDPEGPTPPEDPRGVQQVATVAPPAPPKSLQPHALVTAMEERARQRAERKRELQEMKRKKEEERQAQIQLELEQRQRENEEEKRREAETRREKKRLQREREMQQQRRAEEQKQLWAGAVEHHRRSLLLQHGLLPLKRLLEKSRSNAQLAHAYHGTSLQRRCLLAWSHAARQSAAEKEERASRTHRHALLRRSLHAWHKVKQSYAIKSTMAERFFETLTLRRTLRALQDHVTLERLAAREKERQAEEHWLRCVTQRCFEAWRGLPRLLREERARELRREQLRRRVAEILPDFHWSPAVGTWGSPPNSERQARALRGVHLE